MSKSSRATPTPDLVRELRDDELQEVSGGYVYDSTMWWVSSRLKRKRLRPVRGWRIPMPVDVKGPLGQSAALTQSQTSREVERADCTSLPHQRAENRFAQASGRHKG
jgi:hypothetical protein